MKMRLTVLTLIGGISLMMGCSLDQHPSAPGDEAILRSGNSYLDDALTVTFLAGKTIDVGTVTVANDADSLYITIETTDDWYMLENHVAVATSLDSIPQTKSGNPKVGHFPYKNELDPPSQTDGYAIDLSSNGWEPDTVLYIAVHAEVQMGLSAPAMVYGLSRDPDSPYTNGGQIYEIDLGAGTATFVFDTGLNPDDPNWPNGAAYDAAHDRLYYATRSPSELYFYDYSSSSQVYAGALTAPTVGCGSCYQGKYYYVANLTDDLHEVGLNPDGTVSYDVVLADFTGGTITFDFGDIVIGSDGILYGSAIASPGGAQFFQIDFNNAYAYAWIADQTGPIQLAYGSDGILYGHSAGSGDFYSVDPQTGAQTSIGGVSGSVTGLFTDLASGAPYELPEESAWAEGESFPGGNWAMWFNYTVADTSGGSPGPEPSDDEK